MGFGFLVGGASMDDNLRGVIVGGGRPGGEGGDVGSNGAASWVVERISDRQT